MLATRCDEVARRRPREYRHQHPAALAVAEARFLAAKEAQEKIDAASRFRSLIKTRAAISSRSPTSGL